MTLPFEYRLRGRLLEEENGESYVQAVEDRDRQLEDYLAYVGSPIPGPAGPPGTDGNGWTGGLYNAGTGKVTFTSDDGLGFVTGDLRGADGTDGTGWTGGSYNAGTGIVTFTSTDGLGFSTGDLRGAQGIQGIQGIQGVAGTDGLGWTGGSYNSGTGVVTFTSADGLGFVTGDLRGSVSDPLLLSDGSAAAPTFSFASDGDTGVFLPAANQLGFAAGGVELLRVGSADVDVMTGHLNLISNTGAQTMSLGEWSSGYDYAAVETPSMVVLMGNASDVNSQGFIRTKGTGSFNLGTNNSNDLTIANGGNVGIGTTSPAATLHVQKDVDAFVMKVENDGDSTASDGLWVDTRWNTSTNTPFKVTSNSGAASLMTIKGNGTVGIGTTSPSTPLHISSSGSDQFRLQNTTSSTQGPFMSLYHSTGRIGYIGFPNNDDLHLKNESSGGHIFLSTNNTTRMFVKSNGYVGIGTTAPVSNLHVVGSSRASTGFYVGASGDDGIGPVTGQYGSVQTVGSGAGGWEGYSISGRAVFMNDGGSATGIYNDVNNQWIMYSVHNAATDIRYAGSAKVSTTSGGATITGSLQVNGRHLIDLNVGSGSWSSMQLLVQSANTSTSSNLFAGIALHNRRYGLAPIIRNYGPYGETIDFTNSISSAFIPIRASSFIVSSTIRIKDDIRAVEDADAIKMAEDFLLVSYTPKVRPQTMRPNERFKKADAKWQESGRPPLTLQPAYTDHHDHDCSIDNCDGSLGNECPITVNDTRVYSGLAEWTGETNPEIAFFDEGGIAESLDVAQIASSALGATGSLSRKLTAAMEMIDSLQSRLAVLEGLQ